ncbi:LytTR family two component transcriptional regulator [Ulvibacter sp. MAR_2010_11]|uniref:LytR/AlgR family response regulator transcription factor n=1 Tax=Ulvibacter sp. MAR_2010_11 TaxID=1250229 RepID=UPI000C2CC2F2|nr:LytTR family DNA-binding domain-containing protein [Ulvibacter sp. MAR_2010_11]PKA83907.1 LytTR family two component transcriptional regulator [Ulvibacter sp. MAR_2010_11]
MKLKAIIVDDENHSRETLKNLLTEFCPDVEVLVAVSSVEEAITSISGLKPDVVFLDIELQTGTGFDILDRLENIDFQVVFTTAFEQYAIKAVKFSSLDYLLKPIDLEELQKAVEKAKKAKDKDSYNQQLETLIFNLKQQQPHLNKICLSTSEGFEFLNVDDILYCKAEGSYTTFKLKNNVSHLVSKHLKEYENLLTDQSFMRVHNGYLINLKEVKKYIKSDGGYILMNNDDTVSISRNKKDDFFEAMQQISK